jgi:uncharacterized RDD family membrane protein YckC
MDKARPLYGTSVCSGCYNGFANRRQFAYFLDWIGWSIVSAALSVFAAVAIDAMVSDPTVSGLLMLGIGWVVFPMIFFCKDGFGGRSPGKAIMGVRVVDRETLDPIGFGASVKRNLPLLIPFMPLIVAFLLMKGQRLGDGWARSRVIWARYDKHPLFVGGEACANCQYSLEGNTSGVCPECGMATADAVAPPVMEPAMAA